METLEEKRKKIPTLKLGPFKFVMGTQERITVSGAGSAVNGILVSSGDYNSRHFYANGSVSYIGNVFSGTGILMRWNVGSNQWNLGIMTNGTFLNRYSSSDPALTPYTVVLWNTSGGALPKPTVVHG